MKEIKEKDPQIAQLIEKEFNRQSQGLVMIPSENFASKAVMEACGSVLTNKYSEGYPGKRYYTGNQFIDQIEQLAIERAKQLFGAEHANVQPHSGTTANFACYSALLKPGDKILSLDLAHGGHLSHGSPVNFSGQQYKFIYYGVDPETEAIDMEKVRQIALKEKPKLILSGITAYPRIVEFDEFAQIAQEIEAYAMADTSHIAGLCLAGLHPDPIESHDVVMTTTTKTLRGPRSAVILSKANDRLKNKYWPNSKKNLAQRIDSSVFPGSQGGPHEHIIAAKAVAFKEALSEEFKFYQEQILKNAQALANIFLQNGFRLVSGGTDNHLLLIDCTPLEITGKQAANLLTKADIYTNFNMIPFDKRSPFDPSGIRLGTPALTSRGMKEEQMKIIGQIISNILKDPTNSQLIEQSKKQIHQLTEKFPVYK